MAGLAVGFGFAMLRHSTGTELAEAGVAIDVVQELLGHRSIFGPHIYGGAVGAESGSCLGDTSMRRDAVASVNWPLTAGTEDMFDSIAG